MCRAERGAARADEKAAMARYRLSGSPQMRAVESSDAVTILRASALKPTATTGPLWPFSDPTRRPVAACQMRAVMSCEAVAIQSPSALNLAELTTPCARVQSAFPVAAWAIC